MTGAMKIATGIATSSHFVFFILHSPYVNADPTRPVTRAVLCLFYQAIHKAVTPDSTTVLKPISNQTNHSSLRSGRLFSALLNVSMNPLLSLLVTLYIAKAMPMTFTLFVL